MRLTLKQLQLIGLSILDKLSRLGSQLLTEFATMVAIGLFINASSQQLKIEPMFLFVTFLGIVIITKFDMQTLFTALWLYIRILIWVGGFTMGYNQPTDEIMPIITMLIIILVVTSLITFVEPILFTKYLNERVFNNDYLYAHSVTTGSIYSNDNIVDDIEQHNVNIVNIMTEVNQRAIHSDYRDIVELSSIDVLNMVSKHTREHYRRYIKKHPVKASQFHQGFASVDVNRKLRFNIYPLATTSVMFSWVHWTLLELSPDDIPTIAEFTNIAQTETTMKGSQSE